MMQFRYTLLADGPSDAALLRVIEWILARMPAMVDIARSGQFVDERRMPVIPRRDLRSRALQACKYYPCDILFVHRDAEREPLEKRIHEIDDAVANLAEAVATPIVPVRMTEAWLLHDERAIRVAADNPNGAERLDLPNVKHLERLPDPKAILDQLLVKASEKAGRRLAQFRSEIASRRKRVAALIADFKPIQSLPAMQRFQTRTEKAVMTALASRKSN